MKPTRPINVTGNPHWRYQNSNRTDIAATFARVRRERKEAAEREKAATRNVSHIKPRKP